MPKIISQHFDEEDLKKAVVSFEDGQYYTTLYYKDEVLRVKPFLNEQNAEDYAEDWVLTNE
jgi:hypothetical protein